MEIIVGLQNKNHGEAYQLLLQLEKESEKSNTLYSSFEDFLRLLRSKNSFVRTRGFRLACAQAQWDAEDKLEEHLDLLLAMLNDEKPTAVRQCLNALCGVVPWKPQLSARIQSKLREMDLGKYKDSMRHLIEADRDALWKLCEKRFT